MTPEATELALTLALIPGITPRQAEVLLRARGLSALKELHRLGIVQRSRFAIRIVPITGPLYDSARSTNPSLEEIASIVRSRGSQLVEDVYSLGAIRRPAQVSHDIGGVTECFLAMRDRFDWIPERQCREGIRVPDFTLRSDAGETFGDFLSHAYRVSMIRSIVEDYARMGRPLVLF